MSKPKKSLIIVSAVLLVLIAVGLSVAFSFNTVRFLTASNEEIQSALSVYNARMDGDKPVKFIAHRGLSAEAYQNTEKAFLLAAQEETVWGIETDVWMTGDGGIVCMHDKNAIDGVENVRNATTEKATTTPLRKNKNEYAPTIETYLNICKAYDKVAVVELKDKKITADDVTKILAAIRKSRAKATIISFHFDLLKMVRAQDADIPLQSLATTAAHFTEKHVDELIEMRCDLSAYYQFVTKSIADKFHNAGLSVGIWTVNSAKDAVLSVGEFDVDYITSDVRMAKEIAKQF